MHEWAQHGAWHMATTQGRSWGCSYLRRTIIHFHLIALPLPSALLLQPPAPPQPPTHPHTCTHTTSCPLSALPMPLLPIIIAVWLRTSKTREEYCGEGITLEWHFPKGRWECSHWSFRDNLISKNTQATEFSKSLAFQAFLNISQGGKNLSHRTSAPFKTL